MSRVSAVYPIPFYRMLPIKNGNNKMLVIKTLTLIV